MGKDIPGPTPGSKGETLSGENEPSFDETIDFLKLMRPDGRCVLSAICPNERRIETRTFQLEQDEPIRRWLRRWNSDRNLYWTPNTVKATADPNNKPSEADIEEMVALFVDVDPSEAVDPADEDAWQAERVRILGKLEGFEPAPTAILDSGNGYQAFWVLDEPYFVGGHEEGIRRGKGYNVALAEKLGGDDCESVDHLYRLPGTTNIPDETKRDMGRTERRAIVVRWPSKERICGLGKLDWIDPGEKTGKVSLPHNKPIRLDDTAELEEWNVPADVVALIVVGDNPDKPYKSRSHAVWRVACQLVKYEVPPPLIVGILIDPDLGISEHVRKQRRHVEYAWEQVEKATAEVAAKADNFATDKDGKPYANHQGNVRLALRKLGIDVRHDTFADRSVIVGLDGHGPHLDDATRDRLWLEIDERFRFRPQIEFFTRVLMDTARNAPFHPVCDYLDGLEWDGQPRLDRWLVTYGGAEDSEYTRAVGALPLIAAARRVKKPGAKFDEMLILESEQGTDKSSALRVMAVRDEQFGDDLPLNADGKKVIEQTSGKWIIEAGELKGMRKGEVEHLKSFLSRQDDTARLSYARLPVIVPRQFVVIGTTNSERYLRDLTGNRRFWPVRVGRFDLDALRRDRDQIWAEAAAREAEDASIRLDPSLYAAAGVEQDARTVGDPYVETLATALGDRTGKLRAADVWNLLGVPTSQRTQDQNARVGDAMRELGWKRKKLRFGRNPEWAYAKGSKREQHRPIAVSLGAAGWFVDDAVGSEPGSDGDDLPY